ncbi:MAG: M16 family metallopeptidase [Moraxellaceae bacterium]
MKKSIFFLLTLAASSWALAGHEGAEVAPGPVTSLERLESLKNMPRTVEARRAFTIQRWTTSNGARVFFVEARELPMLDLRLIFDAGGARDADKAGLAAITSRMLEEGTPTRDTAAIARSFESVGAVFDTGSYRDMAVAELRVLSDAQYRDPALDVFADVIAQPAFLAEPLARVMQSSEVALQQQEQSPSAIASRLFYQGLYGQHPYSRPPGGTRETLARIKREDLQAFHQRYYVARNLVIALVGSVSRDEAAVIAEKVSSALPAGAPAAAQPAVKALAKAQRVHKEFPSSQTHIIVGQPGIAYGDPDYYALAVGNEILGGGGFTARLMAEIRQKRGLTYGVYSSFTQMRAPGPFAIKLSTRADQSDEALKIARSVLGDFVKKGPDEQELNEAKASIIGGFPMATASNASIVSYLGAIGFYDMPLDFLDAYIARVQAVSGDDVRAAFRRHVKPDRLLVVTVGKGKP